MLPNVRKLFIPDRGKLIVEADLKGADAQVFAKETGDEALLEDFRQKRDIHSDNAAFMFGEQFTSAPPDSHLRYTLRQQCKHSVHATHNVGSFMALVRHPSIAWSPPQAKRFQSYWFTKHPGIPTYFEKMQRQLETTRRAVNRFGYRIVYFDRIDALLPQAIPWVNQSTVAECTFRGALKLEELPWIEILLQVHDSLVFQIPIHRHSPGNMELIEKTLEVPVPYPEPLVIPWNIKSSPTSWGDC